MLILTDMEELLFVRFSCFVLREMNVMFVFFKTSVVNLPLLDTSS